MVPQTLASYGERFLRHTQGRAKFRTWQAYETALRNHVIPTFGPDTPLVNLTRPVLRDFIAERRAAGYAPRTVHLQFKVLRALLSAAVDDEVIGANPALRMTRHFPKPASDPRARAIPRADLERLLATARRRHPRLADLFVVGAFTGLRIGELLGLRWLDVDLGARTLTVRHSLDYRHHLDTPKSGRPRVVDLSRTATECLATMHEHRAPEVPWLFPGPEGRPWSRTHVRRVMLALCTDLKLPPYTAHALRHSFASLLADAGVSAWVIRDLMGHHDIAITQQYVQLPGRHLAAVEVLDDAR